jgi:hypothetical protein
MHRRAAVSDGSLSPRLGRGEGWGEGPTLSVLGLAPHPTPLPVRTGRGSRPSSPLGSNSI